ncbi:MAG: Cytochrome c biogenesis protein CcdA [Candidatus Uhrbacteria bacterium GW2011_GWF2_39_13]|uniref:Cytochrome c biogenesis protein CcdA n=1 Tax=Candidatus Uhrbacteria bacterium GW2011_GWF2_39_13 TaxID=1618995 RepID=A0A0G0QSS4_9BACT|nr:MAG: Cytochrome c biogenesis protein CcdA [Candidatus Uhrbacteria bacterium GW2011_GWF2_39_13]HAU66428.1 cytochrome C biogenesis protein [Candidatus Uhrbacteria bacterium]
MTTSLIIPAFIAGILTFLAPCTLPLVPAYLGFISGVSAKDLQNSAHHPYIRHKVMLNGLFYVFGFSVVFILMGTLFGIGGVALAKYQFIFTKIGGVFIFFFALYLMGVFEKIPALRSILYSDHRFKLPVSLKPGSPWSSFVFGATFAFSWTPCVGPILGSVLLLASSSSTVGQGAFLLAIFALGLALPFLAIAAGVAHVSEIIKKFSNLLPYISFIGGLFLLFLAILLLTDFLSLWLGWFYRAFSFINQEKILDYL